VILYQIVTEKNFVRQKNQIYIRSDLLGFC